MIIFILSINYTNDASDLNPTHSTTGASSYKHVRAAPADKATMPCCKCFSTQAWRELVNQAQGKLRGETLLSIYALLSQSVLAFKKTRSKQACESIGIIRGLQSSCSSFQNEFGVSLSRRYFTVYRKTFGPISNYTCIILHLYRL